MGCNYSRTTAELVSNKITGSDRRLLLYGLSTDYSFLQGTSSCYIVDLHGLQGNLWSDTWRTSSSSFFTPFGVCRDFCFTFSHSLLPSAVVQLFLPFLKHVVTEALQISLMGSSLASSRSVLEPDETSFVQHEVSF